MSNNERRQDLFDRALAGLRKQGKPSVSVNGLCVYRGYNGCRCAVGWLIPDKLYKPDFEECSAMNARVLNAIPEAEPQDFDFLYTMQGVLHDHYNGVVERHQPYSLWLETQAQNFALSWGLTYTPLEEVTQ